MIETKERLFPAAPAWRGHAAVLLRGLPTTSVQRFLLIAPCYIHLDQYPNTGDL